MNPLEKYRLSQDIFFSLQSNHPMKDIVRILYKYEVKINPVSTYTQSEIKEILSNTLDHKIFSIAKDLNINIDNYVNQNHNELHKGVKIHGNNEVISSILLMNSKYYDKYSFLNVDSLINFIVALLIPKLMFISLKWTSGYEGSLAVTSRLKDASLQIGMEIGIGVFVFLGILSYMLSSYCIEKYFLYKLKRKRLKDNLLTQQILDLIDAYRISQSLRQKLKGTFIYPEFKKQVKTHESSNTTPINSRHLLFTTNESQHERNGQYLKWIRNYK